MHFAIVSGIFLFTGIAQAGTVQFVGPNPVPIGGGQFRFDYNYSIGASERLDPAATSGQTCPGPNNTLIQCNPTGTFFTIYDIPNIISVNAPANWSFTTQAVGVTPSSVEGFSIDNTNLVNVSFFYNGPVIPGPITFTGFSIVTSCGAILGSGSFTAQTTKNLASDPSSGSTLQEVGSVPSPACAATSAPASISGRVTTARGKGIARTLVSMMDSKGQATYVITNAFGYFRFSDVPSGETYTFQVRSKVYTFTPSTRVLNVNEDFSGLNFVASPERFR